MKIEMRVTASVKRNITLAIGKAGAANAALLAAQILAIHDKDLSSRLASWRQAQTDEVLNNPDPREDA